MAAARVALALVFVASLAPTGRAEPCAPRAELGGDAEAVARVAAELQRLGVEAKTNHVDATNRPHVAVLARTSCPVIVAAVELDRSGGIAVAVRDASQRSEGRVVSDAALAAAWIDSWLRDDFTAPVVAEAPRMVTAPPVTAPPVTAPPGETIASEADAPLLDRFSLTASFLQAWTDDSTRWSGVAASACVRVAGLCVGARVGYAMQDVAADLTAAAKRDLSVLATASYSYEVGRMSAAPELGIGVGRLTTSRIEGCKDPNTDPMMDPTSGMMPLPACDPSPGTYYVGDDFSAATYTPRISAALRIAVPLFDHVWLDGLAAATIAPLGHDEPYAGSADGTVMGAFPLPGDPMLGVQLGIGLRLGAP